MRTNIERIKPADVGLSGQAILNYLNDLQACGAEMHGIMIARHNKICAEGWWKPYSPGLIHGLQSLTKSYVTTAIGILVSDGFISLDEKVVDILTDFLPNNISDNLKVLTIRHLLCMGAGNNSMQDRTKQNWLHDFFASDFPYLPGSRFYYSGVVTSVLGAIIRKKTSLGLMEFLKPHLFEKIGIEAGRLKWIQHPDGLEYGGGGLFATTEDNLRLGQLYLNSGVWQGQRILSNEWVKAAASKQINNDREKSADNRVGYGYQMWMCQPSGVYRFDGAHGQFVIVAPDLDMVIAINQMAKGPLAQKTLDITWKYLNQAQGNDLEDLKLATLMPRLSLPRTEVRSIPLKKRFTQDSTFKFGQNDFDLFPSVYRILSYKIPFGIEQITFSEQKGEIIAKVLCNHSDYLLHISLDGIDRLSILHIADDLPDMVYASGTWMDNDILKIDLRYLETCFTVHYIVKGTDLGIELMSIRWRSPENMSEESVSICSIN
jgi:CubicO group peptidase (beta-lactamase class C family)